MRNPQVKTCILLGALLSSAMIAASCKGLGDPADVSFNCAASSNIARTSDEMGILSPTLGGNDIAQSFQPLANIENLDHVVISLQRSTLSSAELGGQIYLTIESNSNGGPSGTPLAFASMKANDVSPKAAGAYTFKFEKPIDLLSANTTYWVRLNATYSVSDTERVSWLGSNTNSYPRGQAKYLDERHVWSDLKTSVNRDLAFRLGCI